MAYITYRTMPRCRNLDQTHVGRLGTAMDWHNPNGPEVPDGMRVPSRSHIHSHQLMKYEYKYPQYDPVSSSLLPRRRWGIRSALNTCTSVVFCLARASPLPGGSLLGSSGMASPCGL